MPKAKIRIANPQAGSARYTSVNQAIRYIAKQEAVWLDDAKSAIAFLTPAEMRELRSIEAQMRRNPRQGSDIYVSGAWEIIKTHSMTFPCTQFIHTEHPHYPPKPEKRSHKPIPCAYERACEQLGLQP
jgi:hypothetical protein